MFLFSKKSSYKKYLLLCGFFFFQLATFAQIDYTTNPTLTNLIEALEGENLQISNLVILSGNPESQIALFEQDFINPNFLMDSGVYFSTGDVNTELSQVNASSNSSSTNNIFYEDEDLQSIEESATFDVVLFQFDVSLGNLSNSIVFSYQFASEEYPDFVGSIYNDVFAIFIEGPGIEGAENIAKIPTSGNPTAVNFVNGGVLGFFGSSEANVDLNQTELYINNGHLNTGEENPLNQPGPFLVDVEFNGLTTLIESTAINLLPGETYQVKIALADTADSIYDSGVFFKPIRAPLVEPELSFTKQGIYLGDENEAQVGDEVRYVFEIINNGFVNLNEFVFIDNFFENYEIEGLADLILAPNESFSFELPYFITQDDINRGALYNTASINYAYAEFDFSRLSDNSNVLDENHPFYNSNCPDCNVVLLPQNPELSLIKEASFNEENLNLGSLIQYNFNIKNTGNVDLFSVRIEDNLPGLRLFGEPITLLVEEENETNFSAEYNVQLSDFAIGKVINQATAIGYTLLDEEITDLSDNEFFIENNPTEVPIPPCDVSIFNTITPNNDGINDVFVIEGIACYPDNTVKIFNRWGVEVFSAKSYDNQDVVFTGNSSARAIYNSDEGLPSGVYFYIIQYTNQEEKITEKGTLFIKREN
ncbi:choice-of-anchor L domain-containing protein [Psychroflexus salis]|uniref:DUF7507 domain-containing protein n=1 Tax=Psychroflexus salis TaxID=1526574 RepID=A0A916ZRW2_9FLAO|nr:choice-of-anchor L domain-containing protein [Psychroflexus salis]GGE11124.1 hypothetical protein GCM10010831_10730 [Psychroflexus salis]